MRFFLALTLLFLIPLPSYAQSPIWEESATNVTIYVRSHDAKFIGTSMGGAYVRVIEKMTGDVLAEGKTYGGTGSSEIIMAESHKRDDILVDANTASFAFSLDILEPTMVTISATAPLAQPQSLTTIKKDMLLIPNKDYSSGNGILLDISGMVVDVLAPMVNQHVAFDPEKPVTFVANVTKLCGCTIEEGSYWPPERYEVEAHVFRDSTFIGTLPMKSMGKSQYATKLKIPAPGTYSITVTAFDKKTKEGGFDKTTIILEKQKDTPSETEKK